MNKAILTAAFAGLLATNFATAQAAEPAADAKEKCYGIAKAGKNGCANAAHSCAGQAAKDNDPTEWVLAAKGTCEKDGGKLSAPKS